MRKFARLAVRVAALGLLLTTQEALAQQNGTAYNWNGFYGGANLGGAWGGSDFLSVVPAGVPFFEGEFYPGQANAATPAIIAAYRNNDVDVASFTGGLQAGYNFWTGGVLFGVEVDINFLNANKSKTTSAFGADDPDPNIGRALYTFRNQIDADYIASLRPRIGIPVSGVLLYVTGGVAVTTLKYEHSFTGSGGFFVGPPIVENASVSETKAGWTLGGGIEVPIASNVTLKAEYLFTDFGSVSTKGNKIFPLDPNQPNLDFACGADTGQGVAGGLFAFLGTPTPRQCFDHKADLLLHSLRLGVNFKF